MVTADSLAQAVTDPKRLNVLYAARLLDTPPEEAFDRFTRLASRIVQAPVALVSLVDKDRQFFKSQIGVSEPLASERQSPLSHSFCQYLVESPQPLVVFDAREHPLFCDNPAIRDRNVIAYLGVPLQTPEGATLGALCTIDAKPHVWTAEDVSSLQDLAVAVMTEIQLRHFGRHFLGCYTKLRDVELQRDELTQMLVHDLRNPLSSLIAGLDFLHDVPALSGEVREYLAIADESAKSLRGMVNDIMDVSKAEAGQMPLDLSLSPPQELVATACRQMEGLAREAGITLCQDAPVTILPIAMDAEKIRRILVNLISNAIQHTPRRGTVKVSAQNRPEDNTLVFEVSDTGVGLPAEAFTQIFEKFSQVGSRKSGRVSTGLGLPFCKKAVEAHGGSISVESALGQGTIFRIEIPYAGSVKSSAP